MITVLETSGLTLGYGGRPVVTDLDLRIAAGEIVALLGPNGAGKTTTLLGLSGMVERHSGTIALGGEPAPDEPHRIARAGLAHVPEDRAIFEQLTVAENLQLGQRSRRRPVTAALELCPELEPLLTRRAGLLSGGEQQMLAVARAMVAGPRVLLVDEMSLGLAPLIVARLIGLLRELADRTGCGILLVEQHVDAALELADRAYVLDRGRIVLDGSARSVRERLGDVEAAYLGGEAISEPVSEPTS